MVAIIVGGTRSGMELLAYSLKKNGVPMVGAPTAGNVLAGTAYLLPDDSLLELAVADVLVDGRRLEKIRSSRTSPCPSTCAMPPAAIRSWRPLRR